MSEADEYAPGGRFETIENEDEVWALRVRLEAAERALEEARQEIADWKESAVNEHQNAQVYKQRAEQAKSRASSLEATLERYRSALERIDLVETDEDARRTITLRDICSIARSALEASEES